VTNVKGEAAELFSVLYSIPGWRSEVSKYIRLALSSRSLGRLQASNDDNAMFFIAPSPLREGSSGTPEPDHKLHSRPVPKMTE